MKILFAGTPEFAVPTLQALIDSSHDILAVYTQPDRPAGRGRQLTPSPVKKLAQAYDLSVQQPLGLKSADVQQQLKEYAPDVMVVVAYGLILPQAVIDIPRYGCVNIHPSLLPRWRGAAPIQRSILAGDTKTAVTTMLIDAGMDSGPILLQELVDIKPLETSGELHDRLAVLGAELLLKTLDQLPQLQATPQSAEGIVHAAKIVKADAELDWSQSALELQHQVCGYNPWPVAFTHYHDAVLRIWQAQALEEKSELPVGTIIAATKQGIDVATGDGVLRVLKLQKAGGKPLTAAEFCNAEQKRLIPQQSQFGCHDK